MFGTSVQNLHFNASARSCTFPPVGAVAVQPELTCAEWGRALVDERALPELISFHGHLCAGLALGVRACEVARRVLGPDREGAELIVAVETDTCSVDAIQQLTGCTLGNGKLHVLDHAKSAYTFWQTGRPTAVRVVARPDDPHEGPHGFWGIFDKVQSGTATDQERAQFFELQRERSQHILAAPDEELFAVAEVTEAPPTRPRITRSVRCQHCGEPTGAHRTQALAGAVVCVPCAQRPGPMTPDQLAPGGLAPAR